MGLNDARPQPTNRGRFYGRDLSDALGGKTPIGLIDSTWGGTRDEAWMDTAARAKCNATGEGLDGTDAGIDAAHAAGVQPSTAPSWAASSSSSSSPPLVTLGEGTGPNDVGALWNGMVYPWLRSTVYGVIWYQGEADCTGGYPRGNHFSSVNYACTFPSLIESWRAHWHAATNGATDPTFPFGFVQLSTWSDKSNSTCGDGGSASCDVGVVRWGQTANVGSVPNAKMPNTFMAVAVDLGDPASPEGDIHPRYKQQVGSRLALAARAVAYKDPKVPVEAVTGPLAKTATAADATKGGAVEIGFANTGGGPLTVKHGVGFEVSGSPCDMTFPYKAAKGTWFSAPVIGSKGSTLTVGAANLTATAKCVRYNWYNAACMPAVGPGLCALYGVGAFGMLLPAPPFVLDVAS